MADELDPYVRLDNIAPSNTYTMKSADAFAYSGKDNSWNFKKFSDRFKIVIHSWDKKNQELIFDMIGIDAPLANAFRRIMLSEVPTIAIENVYIRNNTSIIQDEVLAHRLGLIPILADPRMFEFKGKDENPTDSNSIAFNLHVRCYRDPNNPKTYINEKVLSKDLIWKPVGSQKERFLDTPIKTVHDSILIAKLRHGQEINLEAHCEKGIGADHAKFSPVSTAFYRLMPKIEITEDIVGEEAQELVDKCPMNVFDIEDMGKATVARPRNCSMCRECIRESRFERRINLLRVKNHFIFSVESTGILPPDEIVNQAIQILRTKCSNLLQQIENLNFAVNDD
eukprot:TRINITY_DN8_c0_g1_i1.p1 TRINITY_DN8_c0_g1~~TRINITY_DN8_c0_g1_i1.p1  ORF type:complete len:339 (+),score=37.32 TRINITY_DN8_c0_g1_i1:1017-2033(+)